MARDRADRTRAERSGRRAEVAVALFLRLKGYRILGRNMKTPLGEIDLVARRGTVLCFIEVKRRARGTDPFSVVHHHQRERIVRAANYLLSKGRVGAGAESFRFDVILLTPWRWPRHLTDAWRP